MPESSVPQFTPGKTPKWHVKQSKYAHVNKMLPTRMLCVGASGSGKGVFITSSLLDMWRDCFERIIVFSPTAYIDNQWDELRRYMGDKLGQDDSDEKTRGFY